MMTTKMTTTKKEGKTMKENLKKTVDDNGKKAHYGWTKSMRKDGLTKWGASPTQEKVWHIAPCA